MANNPEGETAGYIVVQRISGENSWFETACALHDEPEGPMEIMAQYKEDDPRAQYAVARLQIIAATT